MIKKSLSDIPGTPITGSGFKNMTAHFALTKDDGMPHYALRIMEFGVGGCTSLHAHEEEHEFFFLEGEPGIVDGRGTLTRLKPGDAVYTAPDEMHQLVNLGDTTMRVVCTIPILPGGDGKATVRHAGA